MCARAEIEFIGQVEDAGEGNAKIRVFQDFCDGLKGIDDFSHLIILYWLHLQDSKEARRTLQVVPRRHGLDSKIGVFACRSPTRPNPLGLCVVELLRVQGCTITVKGLDAIEGSPVVDIKPYIPRADSVLEARVPEWMRHGPPT
jgi:tRNA-Thr(GGU) m(6)t(6)A37 methyltransferase TsaA